MVFLTLIVLIVLVASTIFATDANIKYGGILNITGNGVDVAASFNPFLSSADQCVPFVYEPLMYVNSLNGSIIPMLATAYQWEDNNLKMVVTIRKGVKWSDGVPFTPEDVVFTFNLLKKYPALDLYGIWSSSSNLQTVESSGDNVVFEFSKPNVSMYYYILRTYIVPEHIWSKVKDPTTFTNSDNPVGTGPFLRTSYSVDNDTEYFSKNPNYWWEGRPYIDGVRLIMASSGQAILSHLFDGTTQQINGPFANPYTIWTSKDPENNIIFWPPTSENLLCMNDAKFPFNNAIFRKAIDLAINKKLLEDRAYWGTGGYNINEAQVPPYQRAEWFDTNLATENEYLSSYNPTEAQKLLESIGYKKNASGALVGPDGKQLPTFSILAVPGWVDYITMAQTISAELKAIGIDTTIVLQAYSTYASLLMTGDFDMAIIWAPNGPSPFYTYYPEFYPSFSAPIGQNAISNYSRYTNPIITKALDDFNSTSDPVVQKEAMYTIEKILIDEVPVVVLTNRTGFDFYSQKTFVGWPTISNPYCNAWNGIIGPEIAVLNVHLK